MSTKLPVLLPGSALGVIGGGQLGRYFVIEARRLGYDTWVLDPSPESPAMQWSTHSLVAAYNDADALATLANECDAVTTEFENVPASSLVALANRIRVAPAASAVQIAQDRRLEKSHAANLGIPTAPYIVIESHSDIALRAEVIEFPAILKTSTLGYDGKGQISCNGVEDVVAAFKDVDSVPCVLEQRVPLYAEISVVLARSFDGEISVFPVSENVHSDGILETTCVPSAVDQSLQTEALGIAEKFAEGLAYHGVLALEFFITDNGELLFNEMAPRPHNSGHYTLDATVVSQFEQQVRVLCGLPLGATTLTSPVCMLNLLGDSWETDNPDFESIAQCAGAKLHLYGKKEARPGRKMGHINCLALSASDALAKAHELRAILTA